MVVNDGAVEYASDSFSVAVTRRTTATTLCLGGIFSVSKGDFWYIRDYVLLRISMVGGIAHLFPTD